MAIQLQVSERDPARIVQAIIELVSGRQNSVGDVTLRANNTTTIVAFPNCSTGARVFLFPKTANAAAAVATTYILAANIIRGQFTVTHANNSQADKNFSFLVIGG